MKQNNPTFETIQILANLYHYDMTAEVLQDWFHIKLLPNTPPNNNNILTDNAPYYSR